jgi:drug/metabolite transporter (DMT)-like permease
MKNLINLRSTTAVGYACAFLAAILFGTVSILGKPPLETLNPLLVSSLSYIVAAVTLVPFAHGTRIIHTRGDTLLLILISILGAIIAPLLFFSGLARTSASDASLLSVTEIAFSVLLAAVIFGENLNRRKVIAVSIILSSIVIITLSNNNADDNRLPELSLGNLMIVGAAVFWALDNNLSTSISSRLSASRLVQLKSIIGGSVLLGVALALQIPFQMTLYQLLNILLLGSLGFGASLFFFINALRNIGTVKTVLVFSLSSVFGLLFAFLFLGETITIIQIMVVPILFVGIYLLEKQS